MKGLGLHAACAVHPYPLRGYSSVMIRIGSYASFRPLAFQCGNPFIAPVTQRGLNRHSLPWNAVTFCARSRRALSGGVSPALCVGVTLRVHADESPTASSVAHSGISAIITLRQACLPIYADNGSGFAGCNAPCGRHVSAGNLSSRVYGPCSFISPERARGMRPLADTSITMPRSK